MVGVLVILDIAKYEQTSRGSAQRILCRCDICGAEKAIVKQSIRALYPACQPCCARLVGMRNTGIKRSIEHRRKTSAASKGRKPSQKHVAIARARFAGESNPNWNPDRAAVGRNAMARRELMSLLHNTLKRTGHAKISGTEKMLGYSKSDLIKHLECLFVPGMSWINRGAWHIDHIKPVSAFIADGDFDPRSINALTNLRPLWATENLRKNSHWDGA